MKMKSDEKPVADKSVENCPLDWNVCRKALAAMKKLIQNAQQGHKRLLDDSTFISLNVHVHKIPRCTYLRLSTEIPHPFVDNEARDVCLFVRDDDVNGREYEATIRRYKSMIEQFKLPFKIDVMTLKQLNQELVPYEAKRKLCARYDLFLSDRRIMTSLMRGQLLGKHFRHHGKMPIGVNVFNKDLKQRLMSICSSSFGRMSGNGPLFSMKFTTVEQSIDEGLENLKTICRVIEEKFPGGWANVEHASFRAVNSESLPIYYSSKTKNQTDKLNLLSEDKEKLLQLGELTTLEKNLNVLVQPNGKVFLTKRKKLKSSTTAEGKKAKKSVKKKRLERNWLNPIRKQTKEKTTKKKPTVNDEIQFETNEKEKLVETAFVERVQKTKLAKKNEKQKHVELFFASEPAPNAEKRKRSLATAKINKKLKENASETSATVQQDVQNENLPSAGRNKKKIRL